ncbi:MAG: polyphosphate kinase 2 family protein [Oscillospiraceae bacterium]|jgi:PPK2 family polyphosphate:nucleotide phosphotransferase|nr:polyphosphate kinase 2 family protein [Oscillospiraceae bacterium]
MNLNNFCFDGKKKFNYKTFNTSGDSKKYKKEKILKEIQSDILKLKKFQDRLYAEGKEAVLIIIQAMDAAGKDGIIKHVMAGINPQGVKVSNFKQPSVEELAHDYLWRSHKVLPRKGRIGIFNRSYYEDVLVSKVHELYKFQLMPKRCKTKNIFKLRYKQIVNFEKYLWENGVTVLKFFLCISKKTQKERFLKRIDDTSKNWKFSKSDLEERKHWGKYMSAYQDAINATGKKTAAWYVIPADQKWYARRLVLNILLKSFKEINPKYPEFQKNKRNEFLSYKKILTSEEKK